MIHDIINNMTMDPRTLLRSIKMLRHTRSLARTTPAEEASRKAKRKAAKQARKRNRR